MPAQSVSDRPAIIFVADPKSILHYNLRAHSHRHPPRPEAARLRVEVTGERDLALPTASLGVEQPTVGEKMDACKQVMEHLYRLGAVNIG
jgi:hypothetical protein